MQSRGERRTRIREAAINASGRGNKPGVGISLQARAARPPVARSTWEIPENGADLSGYDPLISSVFGSLFKNDK